MFRQKLEQEFAARREKNPRYSLRAFAAFLGTDHSSLAQMLGGKRRVPVRQIRLWAKKLGMSSEEASAYMAAEHVPDGDTAQRLEHLRHWTAEALAIVTEPAHWEIIRLSRTPGFRSDSRWVAGRGRPDGRSGQPRAQPPAPPAPAGGGAIRKLERPDGRRNRTPVSQNRPRSSTREIQGVLNAMSNPVMQFQILSKTPDETAQFYSALFGWSVDADNPMGYRRIDTGSPQGIQGGIWPAPPQAPNFVQLFIAVEDMKACRRARAATRAPGS